MATTPLPFHFSDLLKLLNAHEVRYLLIGGWAVGHYGYTRATHDFDIWVATDEVNARRVRAAVLEFIGVAPEIEHLRTVNKIIRMGVPPHRVEITTSVSGVAFDECYAQRVTTQFGDVPATVISFQHLLANKTAAGRPKDLADVDELTKINRKRTRPR